MALGGQAPPASDDWRGRTPLRGRNATGDHARLRRMSHSAMLQDLPPDPRFWMPKRVLLARSAGALHAGREIARRAAAGGAEIVAVSPIWISRWN